VSRTLDSAPRAPLPADETLLAELVVGLAAFDGLQAQVRDPAVGGTLHSLRQRFLRMFRQECDRLDLERAVSGRLELRVEAIGVRRICEELAAVVGPLAGRSRITVEVEADGGDAVLRLDRDRVEQVLVMLVAEVLRVVDAGGRVAIRLQPEVGGVSIALAAPGPAPIGVTPGLALAAALLRRMGGELRGPRHLVLRDAPGAPPRHRPEPGGAMAEWIAELRRSPEVRLLPVDAATDRQATLAGHGLVEASRVLLVSDDAYLGRLVALLLDDRVFLVTAGVHGGPEMAETMAPQVVLCDRGETVERLRASRRPTVPILLLAGPQECGPSAADAVLRRPFSAPELRAALRRLLRAAVPENPVEEDRLAALSLVAAGVAHEVLNPLWFSTLALFDLEKVLARGDVGQTARGEAAALVESMRIGLDRVSSVMADLRAYALREAAAQPATTDLHEGIRRTLRLLLLRRPEGVRVHTELCDDGRVVCRAGRMNQVFFNLVLNALQAVGDEGDVWIRSWIDGDRLCVSVRDSGPGIPPEHLGNLFRPFFTTKDPGRSSGLGLASSRRIVKDHGGEIHVRSEPRRGSEFVTLLPRRPAPPPER
jgi:signal transduction histidine kinase